jgi:hypothetical protein
MVQTLTAISSIPTTILTTTASTLSANIAQLQNLSNRQVLAFEVECLCYRLKQAGGVDYTANHPQLRQDAESLLGVFQMNDNPLGNSLAIHVEAAIEWNAASQASSGISTDVSAIIITAGRLSETPSSFLWIMVLYLRYCLSILAV